MDNFKFNGYCNVQQGIPGATNKVADILEELVDEVDTLTRKGLLMEGDIEALERAAGQAEVFLRPQSEEPAPWIGQLADANFNGLTPNQTERLAILAEEMGEALQLIGKILRHGYESTSPVSTDLRTNREMLAHELTDVEAAITMIARDIPAIYRQPEHDIEINKAMLKKLMWSHHQKSDFAEFIEAMDKL